MKRVNSYGVDKIYYLLYRGQYVRFLFTKSHLTDRIVPFMLFEDNRMSFVPFDKKTCSLYNLEEKLSFKYKYHWTCTPSSWEVFEKYICYPNTKLFRKLYPQGIENGNFLEVRDVL